MKKVILLQENSLVHTTKAAKAYTNDMGCRRIFLIACLPDCALIELIFRILKRKLIRQTKGQIIDLSKREEFYELRK
jgi:hypothetical protein